MSSRRAFAILAVIATACYLLTMGYFEVGAWHDDGVYVVLAKSIAGGQGYARINSPTPQLERSFPIGYPLLLSPLTAVWPSSLVPLQLCSVFLTLVSLLILKWYFDFRTSPGYVLLIVAAFAFNPQVVTFATTVMSETAYTFWSLLTLYLIHRFEPSRHSAWHFVPLIALMLCMSTMTRVVGVSLAIACVLWLIAARAPRSAIAIGVLFSIGIVPQIIISRQAGGVLFPPDVAAVVNPLAGIGKMSSTLFEYMWVYLPQYGFSCFGATLTCLGQATNASLMLLLKLGLLSVVALGFVRVVRRKLSIGEIYFLCYLGALSVTIDETEPRYLLPVLPFICFYLIEGLGWLSSLVTRRFSLRNLPQAVLSAILVLFFAVMVLQDGRNVIDPMSKHMIDFRSGTNWIAANSTPRAIVMTGWPCSRFLYADRRTVDFPQVDDEQSLLNRIDIEGVSHVLISLGLFVPQVTTRDDSELEELQTRLILPVLRRHPDRFQLVYESESGDVSVYQVVSGS